MTSEVHTVDWPSLRSTPRPSPDAPLTPLQLLLLKLCWLFYPDGDMADRQQPREASETSPSAAVNPSNGSSLSSPRSSTDSRSSNRNQLRVSQMPPANHQHRQSLSEALRSQPGSPRARRQPSLTQSGIQSLIDNPPPPKNVDPAFVGRDWREISIGELVSPTDLQFVELDTGIEEATNVSTPSIPEGVTCTAPELTFPRC